MGSGVGWAQFTRAHARAPVIDAGRKANFQIVVQTVSEATDAFGFEPLSPSIRDEHGVAVFTFHEQLRRSLRKQGRTVKNASPGLGQSSYLKDSWTLVP